MRCCAKTCAVALCSPTQYLICRVEGTGIVVLVREVKKLR
jgi:hypothetical protein